MLKRYMIKDRAGYCPKVYHVHEEPKVYAQPVQPAKDPTTSPTGVYEPTGEEILGPGDVIRVYGDNLGRIELVCMIDHEHKTYWLVPMDRLWGITVKRLVRYVQEQVYRVYSDVMDDDPNDALGYVPDGMLHSYAGLYLELATVERGRITIQFGS